MFRSNFRTITAVFSITALLAVALLSLNLSAKTEQTTAPSRLQVLNADEMAHIAGGVQCYDQKWSVKPATGRCILGACNVNSDCGTNVRVYTVKCSCSGSIIQNENGCETYPTNGRTWIGINCVCQVDEDRRRCLFQNVASNTFVRWCQTSNDFCGTFQ